MYFSNVDYVRYLQDQGYFDDVDFMFYLKYLVEYWQKPEFYNLLLTAKDIRGLSVIKMLIKDVNFV